MKHFKKLKPFKRLLFFAFLIVSILLIYFLYLEIIEPMLEKPAPSEKTLSEMQITACNAADKAGTCDTRLAEVGIVLKEDCCNTLGKCC